MAEEVAFENCAELSSSQLSKSADTEASSNEKPSSQESSATTRTIYGQVELTLEQCVLPEERLTCTPSMRDGLSKDDEMDLRILGCELIQVSGILLRLPQVAMATGQVLFQRFYYSESFVRQTMEIVAIAAVTLASKIEEAPRRIRDVINVFHHMKQIRNQLPVKAMLVDQEYVKLKNQVIKAERRLLKELGFCVHIKHPHKLVVTLLEIFLGSEGNRLIQTAWNYMNDCLRTEVFVKYSPETIACSCIYLGARVLGIPLPSKPAWFEIFRIKEKDIRAVSKIMLALYTKPKADQLRLEKVIEDLRREYELSKQRTKAMALLAAKGSASTLSHLLMDMGSSSVSNSPAIFSQGTSDSQSFKHAELSVVPMSEVVRNGKESPSPIICSNNNKDTMKDEAASRSRSRSRSTSVHKNSNQEHSPHSKNNNSRRTSPRDYDRSKYRVHPRSRSRSHERHRDVRGSDRDRKGGHVSRRNRKRDYARSSRSRSPAARHKPHNERYNHGSGKKSRRERSRERNDNRMASSYRDRRDRS